MFEIAESDVLRSLQNDNPWWAEAGVPAAEIAQKKRAYFAPFAALAQNWGVRRSLVLMGPRRVGKTVMLHQLIADLIDKGFDPLRIFYVSVDTPLYTEMPLERLINLFQRRTGHDETAQRVVIFDEIQYLKEWEVHLKSLTDRYPHTRFVASGSAAAALNLKSRESGAGRFTDFLLPPLTFAEFLDFIDLESNLIEPAPEDHISDYMTTDINMLNKCFLDYLNYGGYPEAVLNPSIREDAERFLGRDIIDKVLLRDLPSLYGIRDVQELNRLFTMIAYRSGSEISLDGLAQSSGVSKSTIIKYLEYLEAAFLIFRVDRVDQSGKTFRRARRFKAYLSNPSMRSALFAPLMPNDAAVGAMAETGVFSQWYHSLSRDQIHYARWKRGRQDREVDLVRLRREDGAPSMAMEIKWTDRHVTRPESLAGLIEFAKTHGKAGIVIGATTRDTERVEIIQDISVTFIPCAIYSYAIGKNIFKRFGARTLGAVLGEHLTD